MADFCKQCSIELFGADTKDMAGLSTAEDTTNSLFCGVICEGCGGTQVDHEGKCIHHGDGNGFECFKRSGQSGIRIE